MANNIKVGSIAGTGAALNISCGFEPVYVHIYNPNDAGSLAPSMTWWAGMGAGDALKGSTTAGDVEETTNGITVYAGAENLALTGTVAVTAASKVVTGTSTLFLSEVAEGDLIQVDDTKEVRRVDVVLSNTSLTVDDNFDTADASSTATNLTGPAKGFTLGADADVNVSGETFFYLALGAN